MRAKARAEGVHPTYKASETDILQGALEMHDTMVKLNREKQTVLRVARACGWLHYRPDRAGNLVEAGRQPWAKDFPEGHSKLGPELLAQRGSFVQEGKPVPLEKREEGREEEGERQPARQFEDAPTHSGFFSICHWTLTCQRRRQSRSWSCCSTLERDRTCLGCRR